MSDRDELEALVRKKQEAKRQAQQAAEEQQRTADEMVEKANQRRREMMSEVAELCKRLLPFRFKETNHELQVKVTEEQTPKVILGADHIGGDSWDGWVPFVTVSIGVNGKYEVTQTGGSPVWCGTFAEVRQTVLEKLSDIDRESLSAIFKHVQQQRRR